MADFDIQYNGVPITSLVIPSNSSTSRQLTVVAKNGAASAGKLVQIGTSCLLFISDVNGNLDSH